MNTQDKALTSNASTISVLFIGDIIGKTGRRVVANYLPIIKREYGVDLTVANGENAAGGFGITPKILHKIYSYGIDIVTTGNHVWNKGEIQPFLESDSRLIRPLNYPEGVQGKGYTSVKIEKGFEICVVNLMCRTFMFQIDCPFRAMDKIISGIREKTNIIIVDIHGEATSEKAALAWYLDGKVSAVIGTHTHVQTADERILPAGTGFITDAGMTGPVNSVIGIDPNIAIKKFLYTVPIKFKVVNGVGKLNSVLARIDPSSGKTVEIVRVNRVEDEGDMAKFIEDGGED